MYRKVCTTGLTFLLQYKLDGGPLHTLSIYLPVSLQRRFFGLLFLFISLGQEKFLLLLQDIDLISLFSCL